MMNPRASRMIASVAGAACLLVAVTWAQEPPADDAPSFPVAAVVNGEPIYMSQVEEGFAAYAQRRRVDPAQADKAKAEVLVQLINQRLVVQMLERDGGFFKRGELDQQMEEGGAQVRKQYGMTLQEYARARGLTVESLRKERIWRLGWERYVERNLADALEEFFNKHKKDLDGTEVRASHILLRPEEFNETRADIETRAAKIRDQIETGKITFEEAAKKNSAGPSREQGGDLGFFPRFGVMVPEFTAAAFALEKGELSQPVATGFGTHLIRVTDIKPGTRQWTEVIPQIKSLASVDLLKEAAAEEWKKAKVEYSGLTPYVKADTKELVVPKRSPAGGPP